MRSVGILMFVMKYFVQHQEITDTVVSTVGALVGMIPGGMILLTSGVLAVSSAGLVLALIIFSDFFKLVPLTHNALIMQIVTAIAMVILFNVLYSISDKEIEKRKLQPHKATA